MWRVLETIVALAAAAGSDGINPWGMLGCAVGYAAALLAVLDALADLRLARETVGTRLGPGHTLKFSSRITAAGITVVTAGVVLLIDENMMAFVSLTAFFIAALIWSLIVFARRPHKQ